MFLNQWHKSALIVFMFYICIGLHSFWVHFDMSCNMRFPTIWFMKPAKPQISLRICAVWSQPLVVTWIFYKSWATDWTLFGVSKLIRRLQRLVWDNTCQNATLLKITCQGSYYLSILDLYMGQAHKILVLIAYALSRQSLGFPHTLRMEAEEGPDKKIRPLAWQFKGGYCAYVFFLFCFVALHPESTAMVMAGRSVHLTFFLSS